MPALTYYEPSRIGDYNEGTQYCSISDSECNEECTPRHESQRPVQQLGSNGEPNDSDHELHRQSNTVSSETWERAIEDVVIHGRSLRRTAKAHGVHFATLHRRIKKRSQQKESLPYDPHYIPLEDEAGIVSIIQARANLGVIMSYAEVEDLLLHSALNHRAELSIHDATKLVRKFCSRVEASVHHLVKDWPLPAAGELYSRLEPASPTTPTPPTPPTLVATTIPTETGDIMPLTSSSTSSVSPHPILPPVSALHRISGSGPAISALMLPRGEWSGGMGAMATAAATAEVTPTAATSSGVALASDEIILYL